MSDELLPKNKLRWGCRRGMLELDILLADFFEKLYDDLPMKEKLVFQALLIEADQTLLGYFMGHEVPEDKEILNVVEKIRGAVAA